MTKPSFEELLGEFRTAMLISRQGKTIHSRPMALAKVEPRGKLWFVTSMDSDKLDELLEHPEVALTMQKEGLFVSVTGTALLRQDRSTLDDLWNIHLDAWFEGGRREAVAIEVQAEHAEYWSQSLAQRVRYLFEVAKASLLPHATIDPSVTGDAGTVELR